MNYQLVYDQFIQDRRIKERYLESGTFDVHHIVPRALEGNDAPENLIRLSHSDHLFAHVLLARIYGGKLLGSVIRMTGMRKYRGRKNRDRYDHMRRRLSQEMMGNKRGAGVKHTEEFKRALSERSKGKRYALGVKRSPERIELHRQAMLGNTHNLGKKRPHKPETIEKIRQAALRRHARERSQDAI